jgi:hypothetical protein
MGTRLYPKTKDASILEAFAHVRKGTAKRLEALETAFGAVKLALHNEFTERLKIVRENGLADDDGWIAYTDPTIKRLKAAQEAFEEAEYQAIQADTDVSRFHNFQLFGWGKFDVAPDWFERKGLDRYCDSTNDPDEVAILGHGVYLSEQEIATLKETGGVVWG